MNKNVSTIVNYEQKLFFSELSKKLEKAEEDVKQGRKHSVAQVFKKLRDKYNY